MKKYIIPEILILIGLIFILINLKGTGEPQFILSPQPTSDPEIINNDPLIDLINIERQNKNLSPLIQLKELTILAQARVEHLYSTGQWSHEGFTEAVSQSSLKGIFKENLARGIASDSAILNAWLESLTHTEVLFSDCKYAGLGKVGTGQIGTLGADLYIVLWLAECKLYE